MTLFKPLGKLCRDYYIIVVTNQAGIARGYFTISDLDAMNSKVKTEIEKHGSRVDAIYFCHTWLRTIAAEGSRRLV